MSAWQGGYRTAQHRGAEVHSKGGTIVDSGTQSKFLQVQLALTQMHGVLSNDIASNNTTTAWQGVRLFEKPGSPWAT